MEETDLQQKGQSLVVVAIVMLALVAFVALTIDMSSAYMGRRLAQNAADAAALAGARQLGYQINQESFSDTWVRRDMNDLAERNDIQDTGGAPGDETNGNVEGWYLDEDQNRVAAVGEGSVPADVWGIEAITYMTSTAFLGGVMGYNGYPLQAEAAVMLQKACGVDCVVPIATHARPLTMTWGTCFEIWNGVDPGNFGWVNWDLQPDANHCGGDSPCVAQNLDPDWCNSGFVAVGMEVDSTTGVKKDSKIRGQLDKYLGNAAAPYDTPHEFTTIVWEEVLDPTGTNTRYIVAGFARVQLIAYKLANESKPTISQWLTHPLTDCVPSSAGDPENKNILWAEFRGWIGGEGGKCKAVGTVRAPILIK